MVLIKIENFVISQKNIISIEYFRYSFWFYLSLFAEMRFGGLLRFHRFIFKQVIYNKIYFTKVLD